jgi:SAM-dependent methyltransferase
MGEETDDAAESVDETTGPKGYDRIGTRYAGHRRPDPRIAAAITRALGDAGSVLNIGAGAGSYEPTDRRVLALEPSETMVNQRPPGAAPAVLGTAEHLPFPTGSFDAALGVLTTHHWADVAAGLAEMRRVARRQVLFTFEYEPHHRFWLFHYFPEALRTPVAQARSTLAEEIKPLGDARVEMVPIPHDCRDGFLWAYWCRPEMYLDAEVCGAISILAQLPDAELEAGQKRLAHALDTGEWHRRHGHLLEQDTIDGGFRLVIADAAS